MSSFHLYLGDIEFLDDSHREQFRFLLRKFEVSTAAAAGACYISAVPDILRQIDWTQQMNSPYDWFFSDMDRYNESQVAKNLPTDYRLLVRSVFQPVHNLPVSITSFLINTNDMIRKLYFQAVSIHFSK